MNNPYQAPASDVRVSNTAQTDSSNLLSPKGRFTRLSYIAWVFIVGFIAQILIGIVMMASSSMANPMMPSLVAMIVQAPALVMNIIFTIRRCHDINKSGLWAIVFVIPIINFYLWVKRGSEGENDFGALRPTTTAEQIIAYICIVLGIVGVIAIGVALTIYKDYLGI